MVHEITKECESMMILLWKTWTRLDEEGFWRSREESTVCISIWMNAWDMCHRARQIIPMLEEEVQDEVIAKSDQLRQSSPGI